VALLAHLGGMEGWGSAAAVQGAVLGLAAAGAWDWEGGGSAADAACLLRLPAVVGACCLLRHSSSMCLQPGCRCQPASMCRPLHSLMWGRYENKLSKMRGPRARKGKSRR
jgi:hypothetical protein